MNFITTNIRLPEDLYMELKTEAARKRKSLAAVVRERIENKNSYGKTNTEIFMKKLEKLARENDRENRGISFSQKLIEMRNEQ